MALKKSLLLFFIIAVTTGKLWSQCDRLKSQISISFKTDQDCAPVTVTEFDVTYSFSTPQVPSSIEIKFQWNDPANTVTVVDGATGLIVGGGNTTFSANKSFRYDNNNGLCAIQPNVSIYINGVQCTSSIQTQTAFFWGDDEQGNGVVALNPQQWEVCFNNAIVDARLSDASQFNCNMNVEPDHPNQRERHVQFVYGTNHNPAASIRNLTLNDGAVRNLTNAAGALSATTTRGTGAVLVTGAFFGPVDAIPFPADGPSSVTFPMSAPADAANAVGNRFEVTLYNWNTCNPWNGDAVNPNYEDAVLTRGYVVVVETPQPAFVTRDAGGNLKNDFCIDEVISFRNATPNVSAYSYTWQFYDDPAGVTLLQTSTQRNPSFTFTSGGSKLIRLTARNAAAESACTEVYTGFVNVTPSLTARISVTDSGGNPITPDFCQENTAPLTAFGARFSDISSGTVTPTTRWRWEFYNESNALAFEYPVGGGFSNTASPPFDRVFSNRGIYRVRLRIRDNLTSCESVDEVVVRVFEKPDADFSFTRVCEGTPTTFTELSTINPIAGEQIVLWEWDLNYDGATFLKDPTLDNQRTLDFTYASAGAYKVALRVTTNTGACASLMTHTVAVDPLPVAAFTMDRTSGCSLLPVRFTNNSVAGQPDIIREFIWEVDDGSGFVTDAIQRPTDPGFSNTYDRNFVNTGSVDLEYQVRLRVITIHDCDVTSAPVTLTVFPQPRSGFVSLNYSPFNSNCSPVAVDFTVDTQTQALQPTDYTWTIEDAGGPVDEISTGTTPSFQYAFQNNSLALRDFTVTLRATLPSACFGDSTRTIRVSPVPSSDFVIDTISYECDRIVLSLEAAQKGLSEYDWNIRINNVLVFSSATVGESFEYEILRSVSIDQNLSIQLDTKNLVNCQSTPTTKIFLAKRTDNMGTSFTASPANQTLPASTVTITNTTNPGPWQYVWDFGDGNTSADPNLSSHTYTTFGNYTISLTVTNNDCVETRTAPVRINPIPPVLDFDYFPSSGCAPHTVTFVNASKYADPASYKWKFGVGEGTSSAIDPTYTYRQPGVFSVTLSATNELQDTVTLTKQLIIEVLDNPVAQFAVYPTTPLNVPGEILYTDNRSSNASDFVWDFGDGHTSTDFEPQHQYTEEGDFTLTLIANNGNGCADTTMLLSGVHTVKSGQLLIPNAFIPNKTGSGSGNVLNNEVFLPLAQEVSNFQMMIFNRWGQLMFESTSAQVGWDGYFQGKLCAQDVYIYRIIVEYENGRTITRTGDITLIR